MAFPTAGRFHPEEREKVGARQTLAGAKIQ